MLDIIALESYVGGLLYLKPGYGWGWHISGYGAAPALLDYKIIDQAGAFNIRVNSFFVFRGELRGVVGKVEQANHFLHDYWISCGDMLKGKHDFKDELSMRYDLSIGSAEPFGEWPLMQDCSPIYTGYGILAEDENSVSRYWDKKGWARK